MKKKLIALAVILALYMLMVALPYSFNYLQHEYTPAGYPRIYVDDGVGKAYPSDTTLRFFPYGFDAVLHLSLYTFMLTASVYIARKLKRKWYSVSQILFALSVLVSVPIMFSYGSLSHLIITGLNPFFASVIFLPIFYQLWFFTFLLLEFLGKVKIENKSAQ